LAKARLKKHNLHITNAKIVLPDKIVPQGTLLVKGKSISAILKKKSAPAAAIEIDAQGNFLAPGFIDLHIHGDVEKVSLQQARGGTTGFLATLHPATPKALLDNIAQVLAAKKQVPGAKVLGVRLEGPFLNRSFCGALPPQALRRPDIKEAKAIISRAGRALKIVVLAPELKGAYKLIRLLKKHRIVPSCGHTAATYEQAIKGIDAGITHATHTFNRMREFDYRRPGATGAVLTDERLNCEVIADGVHVHPAALRLLLAAKGLSRLSLITDSTAAQVQPPKRRQGAVFRLKKDGRLYGTALTLNIALKNAVRFLGLSLPEALRLVTLNPARVLQVDRAKGTLAVGKDADLVIFDKDFKVKMTMVEGKIVYND
jgi:N-acetylglucosamine-6-phosphate deacetylase